MKKFTLVLSLLSAMSMAAVAQISDVAELSNDKCYIVTANDADRGALYAGEEATHLSHCGAVYSNYHNGDVPVDPSNPAQQFVFAQYDGKYYLYSVSEKKFAVKDGQFVKLTSEPEGFVSIEPADVDGCFFVKFNGQNKLNFSGGYTHGIVANYESVDDGNRIVITEAGDFAAADSLIAALEAKFDLAEQERQAALENLATMLEDVDIFLIEDIQYSSAGGDKIELQVSDPAANNYLWCNEPEESEGPIDALIDGDTQNFFHSRWNGPVEAQHWLQIDALSAPLQNFAFEYNTRPNCANDYPDAIEVQGSNDGVNFTTIVVCDKNLPQQGNMYWKSEDIKAEEAYSYIRFLITAERTYFHMAEFAISELPNETIADAYAPFLTYVRQLQALWYEGSEMYDNANNETDEINAMIDELKELMELLKGLVSDNDDPKTIEYLESVKEVYARQGVGYPAAEAREAFGAKLEAAIAKPTTLARLTIQDAIKEYYAIEDVVMPTDGTKYTLTFVTYAGRRNFLNYTLTTTEEGDETYALSMVKDTLTAEGISYPETAVFTCEDNGDGTYSFVTYDNKYLTIPGNGAASGSATGISEEKVALTLVKMYPNSSCETGVTWEHLFGLVAYQVNGVYPAPNSSGSTYYTGSLPHFMGSWTSAMAIEEYTSDTGIEAVKNETVVKGTYDLSGRRVENPVKGIYIVNGKKVLVK